MVPPRSIKETADHHAVVVDGVRKKPVRSAINTTAESSSLSSASKVGRLERRSRGIQCLEVGVKITTGWVIVSRLGLATLG